MNLGFSGKLMDGTTGVIVYKQPADYLETLIKKHGDRRYITRRASKKIAKDFIEYVEEIVEQNHFAESQK